MNRAAVQSVAPFVGMHCETVATGTLLLAEGVSLSEPMLFGLGEGLSFVYLNLSSLPLPFVGGRVKPFELTLALARNLRLSIDASQTSSKKKAWDLLARALAEGRPVGLQLDCFYLDYFEHAPHFAGHFVAAYGMDEQQVWVVDTRQQGSQQTVSRQSLEAARHARGPMAARARQWTLRAGPPTVLAESVVQAIHRTAVSFLNPGFGGASFRGMDKLAKSLPAWVDAKPEDRALAATLMERAGTGGALFRNFYRDFLSEASELLPQRKSLRVAREAFFASAECWTRIAQLIDQSAERDAGAPLLEAADLCRTAARLERGAMEQLEQLG